MREPSEDMCAFDGWSEAVPEDASYYESHFVFLSVRVLFTLVQYAANDNESLQSDQSGDVRFVSQCFKPSMP